MAIDLFGSCDVMTVQGIKSLKLAAKLADGSSIHYPLDFIVQNGEEAVMIVVDEPENQIIQVDNQQNVQYVEPYVINSSFEEIQIIDRRGTYYQTTITFEFPKVDLFTNNQIKDFMFSNDGEFAIANATVFLTDNNDVNWVIGYDLPMVIENFELTTGGADNKYTMTLVGKSYNRARRLEYFGRHQPTEFILINNTDFLTINGSDLILI